jgi:N-glycosyltransferase
MRLLFASHPLTGHMRPLLPLALGAKRLGFDVAWAAAPFAQSQIEGYGLRFLPAGYSDRSEIERQVPGWDERPDPEQDWRAAALFTARDVMAGPVARATLPGLIEAARSFEPHLVVRDAMEYAGVVAAESLGIPHASVAADALSPRGWIRKAVADPFDSLCQEAGLAPDPEREFRHLHFEHLPDPFFGDPSDVPASTRVIRHVDIRYAGEAVGPIPEGLGERPLVIAAFGTLVYSTPGLLETVVEALGDVPADVLLAVGSEDRAAELGSPPANIWIQPSIPQTTLLPKASLFLSHGGMTGVKESLAAAVPVVAIPINGDHPYLGDRCAALGVGEVVQASARTPEQIRAATLAVLGDPAYRKAAARYSQEMLALPGTGQAIKMLVDLAESRR